MVYNPKWKFCRNRSQTIACVYRPQSSHIRCYSFSQTFCLYCSVVCPEICDPCLAEGTNFASVLKSPMDLGKLWLNWRWEQELLLYIMFVTHPNLPFLGSKCQNPQARTNKEQCTCTEKKRGDIGAHFILLTTWLVSLPVALTWTLLKHRADLQSPCGTHSTSTGTEVPPNCNSPACVKLGCQLCSSQGNASLVSNWK